eukprot:scaffold41552_cov35-Attheya_sp.AAC.1
MSIADCVVLGVRPCYSHIESECPRVEGDGEYTEMIRRLCFLIDCFDREGTAQQPSLETVDKYVHAWMLNKYRSPGFVEVEALESLFAFVARFDSRAAQIRLSDEMDLHGFPLFWMRLIDLSRHTTTAWEMACWGEGTAEHAKCSSYLVAKSFVGLGSESEESRKSKLKTGSCFGGSRVSRDVSLPGTVHY